MTMRSCSTLMTVVTLAVVSAGLSAARADDACSGFKWDVSKEHALFASTSLSEPAGKSIQSAPTIGLDRLYELKLIAQKDADFSLTPGKKAPSDSSFAGLVSFKVASAGSYRISVDAPLWIDVVDDGKLVRARDYEGQHDCNAPQKIVVFDLNANVPLTLQLSAAPQDKVRLTITRTSLE
jgi:hypothetical protein